ncbi:MAG: TonB-dependent receptor [Chlorobi bacterium]|nr:TonB-dependent receptor [Chlorobiota bacterium]
MFTFFVLFLVLFYFAGVQQVNAQIKQVTVRGTVTTTKGQILPGVTVLVKGTTNGTVTDLDGKYTLSKVPTNATLRFSFVGMQSKEIPVNSRYVIDVTLSQSVFSLNQVVVIGYGTQKKSSITGSVSIVNLNDLPVKSPISAAQMLQGVAGVQVVNSGGPGALPVIRIRGLASFGNNNPLFVIDGIPTSDANDLNPNDIASIQILKDAAAAAIYGSRAENGVVLITTKRGKGAFTISFDARAGVDNVPRYIPMTDATGFARIDNLAHDNAGVPHVPSSDMVISDPSSMPNTDWERALIIPGKVRDYNLSVSKGGDNSSYRFALGYFDKVGIIVGPPRFRRVDLTMSSTHKYKKLDFGTNIRLAYSNTRLVSGNPFEHVLRALPDVAVYNKNNVGGFGYGDILNAVYFTNPVGLQKTRINNTYTYKIMGNIFAEYKFTDYLKYKFNIGVDVPNQRGIFRRKAAVLRYLGNPYSSLTERNRVWINYVLNHTLTFDKVFGKHSIDAVIGFAYEDHLFRQSSAYGEQVVQRVDGSYLWVLNDVQINQKVSGSASETRLYSEFARINYAFDNKYLIQLSIRNDNSSRFSPANREGVFPGVSVGWKIKNENFLKNVDIISSLKLKASYGELGGEQLGAYDWVGYINPNVNYVLGTDQHILNGATQIKIVNGDIKWQTTTSSNIGIDFGLLKDKVFGSIEYYISDTKNAIVPVDLPLSTGNFGGNPFQNIGTIRNSGLELALSYRNHDNEFKYDFNMTFSTLKNDVISLSTLGQIAGGITMTRPGYPIGTFYLLKTNGIFQIGDEVAAAKQGAHPGDVRFIDINGDGLINDKDRVMMGDPFPKVTLGLNVHLEYKGFDLSMFFYSQLGFDIYNGAAWWMDRTDDRFNRPAGYSPWSPTNPSNTTPIAMYGAGGARNFYINQDRYLENGDFMKLKNLEFGYTLSRDLAEKVGLKKLRVYFSGQNLFTLTNYTGWDPEVANSSSVLERGIDWGAFPNPRTVSFGVQGKF